MSVTGDKIFVFGASGHAKVVIDIIEKQGLYQVEFLVDDDPALRGSEFYGYPVLGGKEELLSSLGRVKGGVVAIGSNKARRAVSGWLESQGVALVSCLHPSAQIGRGVEIGDGTVVMAGAVINPDARIGRNVIVNSRASIDHDCRVGDFAHIAPGTTLCGTVTVGEGTFVCAGSTVIPNLLIGRNAVIGAGSTVVRAVPDLALVAGVPARHLKTLEES